MTSTRKYGTRTKSKVHRHSSMMGGYEPTKLAVDDLYFGRRHKGKHAFKKSLGGKRFDTYEW